MKTQYLIVLNKLNRDGKITNVWAVQNRILRLSAHMFQLKADGIRFHTYYQRNKKGKTTRTFVYELVK
jgi:hypothetical protein